jgi:hypothetical protein
MVLPEMRSSEPLVIALPEQLAHPLQRVELSPGLGYRADVLFDGARLQIGPRRFNNAP